MRSFSFVVLVMTLTASGHRALANSDGRTAGAYRAYRHCMLGNTERFARRPGSPDAQVSELELHCKPKFKRLRTVVGRDLTRQFRNRPRVDPKSRAVMITDLTRRRLKRTAVAMITKIRFEL